MTDFKIGDEVRVVRYTRSGSGADTAQTGYIGKLTQVELSGHGRMCIEGNVWARPEDLELVTQTAPAETGEKMIPASKVREIAQRYARKHNWCSVVDRALEEMGATDDTMVDVLMTQTRTVRLRRSDLNKMRSRENMLGITTNERRLQWSFADIPPASASIVSFDWQISDPVEVKDEAGWVDCGERPPVGARVRTRPGRSAQSYAGVMTEGGREGVRKASIYDGERPGILVAFTSMVERRFELSDLQYFAG